MKYLTGHNNSVHTFTSISDLKLETTTPNEYGSKYLDLCEVHVSELSSLTH